jgi:hypothetical protein
MTVLVIEVNDMEIRVSDKDGTKFVGAGVANVSPEKTKFGELAVKASRLDPLSTQHHFWQRLDVEPFAKPIGHYRHHADLVFAHLMAISDEAVAHHDVVFAVPDSFTRHQCSVLLGLAQHCPFKVVGMVDSALLAACEEPSAKIIYIDLQLHQITFSSLVREHGELRCQNKSQLTSAGWIEIAESLLQYINACFIQQSRFNPQHDADSEQYLFDLLPDCLAQIDALDLVQAMDAKNNQTISILHKGTLHQIKLANDAIVSRLRKVYEQIQQQVVGLDSSGTATVLLSSRMQRLPRIIDALTSLDRPVKVTLENVVSRTCLGNLDAIASGNTIQLVTSLKTAGTDVEPQSNQVLVAPTHVLHGHRATRLAADMALINRDGKLQLVPVNKSDTNDRLADISEEAGQFYLSPSVADIVVNGNAISTRTPLTVGDNIAYGAKLGAMSCIEVTDGDE